MPTLEVRTLRFAGRKDSTAYVALPRSWFDYLGLKSGDKVEVIANGEITIRPMRTVEVDGQPTSAPMVSKESTDLGG